MDEDVAQSHIEALVGRFIAEVQRPRLQQLAASPKKRKRLLEYISHRIELDPRWAQKLPHSQQNPEAVEMLLRERGAPEECVVLHGDASDGAVLPLRQALDDTVGHAYGAFVSCLPGRLAYYEAEAADERYLLYRPS